MEILKNRQFWLIAVAFALCSIFHYAEQLGFMGTTPPSENFGLTRHALERILFLVPVIYAAYIFGVRVGFAVCIAAFIVMLPRATYLSPSISDAILETCGVTAVGALATLWLGTRTREEEISQKALKELQRTHEVLQYYVRSARSSEKRLTILNAISNLLGESIELENVLGRSIQLVSELMEVEVTLIYMLDEEEQELVLLAHEGVSEEFARVVDGIKIGEGIYGEVATTGRAVLVGDASRDPRMNDPEVMRMRIHIQLVVPMIIKERCVGVICIAMRRPREFTQDDIELLTAVGTQIATAIENARLYEKERLAARRLAVSERNLRRLFENASDAIWVHDLMGNITVANKAAAKMTGYSVEELAKMNVVAFLPDDGLRVASEIRRKLIQKEPVKQPYEQRLIRKDGTEAFLMMSTDLVTEEGRPAAFQHIARDVTEKRRSEAALRASERELSEIVEGSSVPTFVINSEHKLTHWNKALENLTGVSKREVVGAKKQWMAFYPEERPVMADLILDNVPEEEIAKFYKGKYRKSTILAGACEAEDFFPHFGERGRWLFFTAAPLRDNEGRIYGAIETLQDITERKWAEEAVKESESRYRDLFNSASDAIFIHDLKGNIIESNRAASALTGYAVNEMARMNIRQFLTPESVEVARERQREQVEGRIPSQRYGLEILRKDGAKAVIETAIRLIIESGHPVAFHNIARDVTAERRMQDNLRYYLQQITKAQEEERKRIARELHDETAQDLYALNRELDNFLRGNAGLSAECADFLKGVAGQIKEVLQGVRRFDRDLRPPILDDLGLLSALRWLVDELKGQSGIAADITVSGNERRLSAEAELIVFRIVQEALRNVEKHAEASKLKVKVEFDQGKMKLSISDNGKGFDLGESLAELPRAGKLGLAGMEERVRLLGGTLKIQSKLGKGTTVEIEIPA